jgi:hypothetical protein
MPITTIHGHDQSGPTTALPANADAGFLFYDTTVGQLYCYSGSAWIAIGSAGNPGAGAAGGLRTVSKLLTGMADATFIDLATVNVPNAIHGAGVRVTLCGTLGDGDSTQIGQFHGGISRIAGAATKCTFGAILTAGTTAGATANAAVAIQASSISGANGATQTFTIQGKVTRSAGAASNHVLLAQIELLNNFASGVTIAAA